MKGLDQIQRRDFLRIGAGAACGAGICARAKIRRSCILLSLTGGPSHLDTWDMKPDAPSTVRGPFRPIRTSVQGMEISEIFPRMARHAGKFAILRGGYHTEPATHEAGQQATEFGAFTKPAGNWLDSEETRERYGTSRFGQDCLRARRMVESGASCIRVEMFDSVFDEVTWDVHGFQPFSPISAYRDVVGPMFDKAFTALVTDLHDRGLLATTMVVAMGEFGRTPKINPAGGRDHYPECWSALIAGGPIPGGQVIGSSDSTGSEPRDHPFTPADIAATVERFLT